MALIDYYKLIILHPIGSISDKDLANFSLKLPGARERYSSNLSRTENKLPLVLVKAI